MGEVLVRPCRVYASESWYVPEVVKAHPALIGQQPRLYGGVLLFLPGNPFGTAVHNSKPSSTCSSGAHASSGWSRA